MLWGLASLELGEGAQVGVAGAEVRWPRPSPQHTREAEKAFALGVLDKELATCRHQVLASALTLLLIGSRF